jgi:hypothetical protein
MKGNPLMPTTTTGAAPHTVPDDSWGWEPPLELLGELYARAVDDTLRKQDQVAGLLQHLTAALTVPGIHPSLTHGAAVHDDVAETIAYPITSAAVRRALVQLRVSP